MVEHRTQLDDTYGALAHPARRQMLAQLAGGERRVTDLAGPLPISLAAASKHVRQLELAGLVTRRVAGRDHWLALRVDPLTDAEAWIEELRSFWASRLDALEELLRRRGPDER